jgi:hypothetical protein
MMMDSAQALVRYFRGISVRKHKLDYAVSKVVLDGEIGSQSRRRGNAAEVPLSYQFPLLESEEPTRSQSLTL